MVLMINSNESSHRSGRPEGMVVGLVEPRVVIGRVATSSAAGPWNVTIDNRYGGVLRSTRTHQRTCFPFPTFDRRQKSYTNGDKPINGRENGEHNTPCEIFVPFLETSCTSVGNCLIPDMSQ